MPGTITGIRSSASSLLTIEGSGGMESSSGDLIPEGNTHQNGSAPSFTQGTDDTGLHDQDSNHTLSSVPQRFPHLTGPMFAADELAVSPDTYAPISSSLPPPASPPLPITPHSEMILHDLHHQDHLEIVVPQNNVILRGVGQNYEPGLLQGTVVLNLPEATNIREINLSFYGKARIASGDGRQP